MKPTDRYTKFCQKAPQKAGTYTNTMLMWEPRGKPAMLQYVVSFTWA